MRSIRLLIVVVLSACGGSQPHASAPTSVASFDAMSAAEKMSLMKGTVAPRMKTAFQSFDATDYADFDCKTCHGASASAGNFKMPNPDLPKLDEAHGFAKDKAAHPKAMEFMHEKVMPQMAKMLGQPERSPAHPDGFGCMDCHTAS